MLFAPLVGVTIGGVLLVAGSLLTGAPPGISASILLIAWVALTGALHLDGLADCADAWVGGHGNRERTLEILKDPRSGPIAVTAVVLLLIGKFAALEALLAADALLPLLVAPVLGRAAMLALMMGLRYARRGGIGEQPARNLPRRSGTVMLAMCVLGTLIICGPAGLSAVIVGVVLLLVTAHFMHHQLGGCTGDGLGAACETVELGVLTSFAVALA